MPTSRGRKKPGRGKDQRGDNTVNRGHVVDMVTTIRAGLNLLATRGHPQAARLKYEFETAGTDPAIGHTALVTQYTALVAVASQVADAIENRL